MKFYTYILLCSDDSFYIGSTSNVKKRLHQHNFHKAGAHYTKLRRPVVLQYAEEFLTLSEARARELSLKRLSRAAKRKLCLSYAQSSLKQFV